MVVDRQFPTKPRKLKGKDPLRNVYPEAWPERDVGRANSDCDNNADADCRPRRVWLPIDNRCSNDSICTVFGG